MLNYRAGGRSGVPVGDVPDQIPTKRGEVSISRSPVTQLRKFQVEVSGEGTEENILTV